MVGLNIDSSRGSLGLVAIKLPLPLGPEHLQVIIRLLEAIPDL